MEKRFTGEEHDGIICDGNLLMRWYTNNVLVVIKKGNKMYEKKEPVREKQMDSWRL
ncbi:hypothetical protein ABNG30_29460 [Bacillus thuringiensis]